MPATGGNPTVSEWFITDFQTGVEHVYQDQGGALRRTVRNKTVQNAEDARFHIHGEIETAQKVAGKIPVNNPDHSNKLIPHAQYFANTIIEEEDLDRMAADDRQEAQKAGGMALDRRSDDLIIAALNKKYIANGNAIDADLDAALFGGANSFMSPLGLDHLNEVFKTRNVDGEEVYTALSPRGWSQLMRFKEFTSADYVGPDLPFVKKGMARTYNGHHIICQNRLPVDSGQHIGFTWTERSVGHVALGGLRFNITWENPSNHWYVNMRMSQGADLILPTGVVAFSFDGTVSPISIDADSYTVA